jgi:hypothetical protein
MRNPLTVGTWYPLTIDHVVDGDTIAGSVRLDDGSRYPTAFRLAAINAPEMRGVTAGAGITARAALIALLDGCNVDVLSNAATLDKYGRVVAWIRSTTGSHPAVAGYVSPAVTVPMPAGVGPVIATAGSDVRDVCGLLQSSGFAVPFMADRSGPRPSFTAPPGGTAFGGGSGDDGG